MFGAGVVGIALAIGWDFLRPAGYVLKGAFLGWDESFLGDTIEKRLLDAQKHLANNKKLFNYNQAYDMLMRGFHPKDIITTLDRYLYWWFPNQIYGLGTSPQQQTLSAAQNLVSNNQNPAPSPREKILKMMFQGALAAAGHYLCFRYLFGPITDVLVNVIASLCGFVVPETHLTLRFFGLGWAVLGY